jgi:hypothetical protein
LRARRPARPNWCSGTRITWRALLPAQGAVREVCEFVLRAQGKLEGALAGYLA